MVPFLGHPVEVDNVIDKGALKMQELKNKRPN